MMGKDTVTAMIERYVSGYIVRLMPIMSVMVRHNLSVMDECSILVLHRHFSRSEENFDFRFSLL